MKTLEMCDVIEAWQKDKNKQFYCIDTDEVWRIYHGGINAIGGGCRIVNQYSLNFKFKEAKAAVPFMKAVEAFDEGADIYCMYKEVRHYYKRGVGVGLLDQIDHPVDSAQILDGEWYIEDGEDLKA